MRSLSAITKAIVLNFSIWRVLSSPVGGAPANGIDLTTLNDLVLYTRYSSAAYQLLCIKPLGNVLVKQLGTRGFIARDDTRKEIVVSFRGSFDLADAIIDTQILLTPLNSRGLTNVGNSLVHSDFLLAYNSVADTVVSTLSTQLLSYPKYSVVVTGHSLGGALAAFGAISVKAAHPTVLLKLYTFGQPRTGNAAFAAYVEGKIGTVNIFRSVHTYDGVPTILPQSLGYRHFATEYWIFKDPANISNVKKCTGGEDPSCSDSIPTTPLTFLNTAHTLYYNQLMAANPLLCI